MEGRIDKLKEPFSIRLKQFWDLTQSGSLLGEKFAKSLLHEPDGLIFQPSKEVSPFSVVFVICHTNNRLFLIKQVNK